MGLDKTAKDRPGPVLTGSVRSFAWFGFKRPVSVPVYGPWGSKNRTGPDFQTLIPYYSTLFHMDSILFWMDSTLFHIIPHGLHIISDGFHIILYLFHIISHGFHIIPDGFHVDGQTICKCSLWGHQTDHVFCSVHWVRSHDFPKPVKIFKYMTFKLITHCIYIYYISKKSINYIESKDKHKGLFYSLFWYKKTKIQLNFTKVKENN